MKRFFGLILLGLALPAWAIEFDQNWREQDLPLRNSNQYSLQGNTLGISSQNAISILYRPVYQNIENASWSWQVSNSVPATDLKKKGGDDRNLSVYFVFMPEAEAAAAKGQGMSKVLRNKAAKALIYTYGGNDGRGTSFQSPYLQGRGYVVIHAPAGAASGQENVNLAADYQRAYGTSPDVLVGIGISADSDDTKAQINAQISGLRLN